MGSSLPLPSSLLKHPFYESDGGDDIVNNTLTIFVSHIIKTGASFSSKVLNIEKLMRA